MGYKSVLALSLLFASVSALAIDTRQPQLNEPRVLDPEKGTIGLICIDPDGLIFTAYDSGSGSVEGFDQCLKRVMQDMPAKRDLGDYVKGFKALRSTLKRDY